MEQICAVEPCGILTVGIAVKGAPDVFIAGTEGADRRCSATCAFTDGADHDLDEPRIRSILSLGVDHHSVILTVYVQHVGSVIVSRDGIRGGKGCCTAPGSRQRRGIA